MITVGVVGATGYTGVELLRILVQHPEVTIQMVTSRSEAGTAVSAIFPNLREHLQLNFCNPDPDLLAECDLVFFATPHGAAMALVPELLAKGVKVIDLSADFRIKDAKLWSHWYGIEHTCPELLTEAVYGLPEMNRELIKTASLIANPGCYPTAVQLGFIPLLKNKLVDPGSLIADVKSGVSGAGRKAGMGTLLCEVSENFKAYAINGHRHQPEIVQGLNAQSDKPVNLTFMPHLVPMIRGIQASLYASLSTDGVDLQSLYEDFYRDEIFVDVLEAGTSPETRSVRGSNMCRLAIVQPEDSNKVVVLVVEDNLVKGAAGQAVQNMNIMYGFNESLGLDIVSVLP
ncbi:MAG: N-acetyl-gamma-glutamyl-phosphate reductase [SAR86 cluster bacterium]|uniref:N-acetyl-gamma-glutamyl-phosphate reductase n=1 Tax=SAR86 cluster bacterium TaxID=2030880 RepID=A0A2A5CG16_9GAMM|nr:MAG: N-acetyl-gamma-glutamyl-phosphate reductase [SAR86 cluster bacterium]